MAAKLIALGCGRVSAFGVVGGDPWGIELLRIPAELGANAAGVIRQDQDRATVAYLKPDVGGVEQDHFDFGDFNRLHDETAGKLLAGLEAALSGLDALVINAQARTGIHTEFLRRPLAGIVAALACGRTPVAAAGVGNLAAAGCVGKLRRTGTASPAEMLALMNRTGGRIP